MNGIYKLSDLQHTPKNAIAAAYPASAFAGDVVYQDSLGDILRNGVRQREEAARIKLAMIEHNMEYHELASHCARLFMNERMDAIFNPKPKVS